MQSYATKNLTHLPFTVFMIAVSIASIFSSFLNIAGTIVFIESVIALLLDMASILQVKSSNRV